ncbi:hypothetical protein Daus18300_002259 [Diaporthe australafricana]|uniref:Heterokaryon incompatibility domain-containing protein n=1 Tax=Diaporthe australafricana TaxID=127596 RepID=A0ABR3XPJ8_9PEZI
MPPSVEDYAHSSCLDWMGDKLKHFPRHGHSRSNPDFLPDRLIFVGADELRLVLRSQIVADPNVPPTFAALSYCWGSPVDAETQPKTTTSSLGERLRGLRLEELTPVMKDAVRITRALSIPLLWIDALCVLQDDMTDWVRQCGQMQDIYGTAHVTLCAASSTTCREGFLRQRVSKVQLPFVSQRRPGEVSGSFVVRLSHSPYAEALDRRPVYQTDLEDCRWARRGWTFQESIMASRKILFGDSGLHFICGREVLTQGNSNEVRPPWEIAAPALTSGPPDTPEKAWAMWDLVLRRYSRFTRDSFTKPGDCLPALSGLARMFGDGPLRRDEYLAGHWKLDMHRSLMWQLDRAVKPSMLDALTALDNLQAKHNTEYLLPSWSCLMRGRTMGCGSINNYGEVTTQAGPESLATAATIHRDVLGLESLVVPANKTDQYGAIRGGGLRCQAYCLEFLFYAPYKRVGVPWSGPASPWEDIPKGGRAVEFSLVSEREVMIQKLDFRVLDDEMDVLITTKSAQITTGTDAQDPVQSSQVCLRLDMDFRLDNQLLDCANIDNLQDLIDIDMDFRLMLLGHIESPVMSGEKRPPHKNIYGLLLCPVDEQTEERFHRIGVFQQVFRSHSRDLRENDGLEWFKTLGHMETIDLN